MWKYGELIEECQIIEHSFGEQNISFKWLGK